MLHANKNTTIQVYAVILSVAAALFNNHILVVPQGQVIVLVVQHGERGEACRHTGRAGHSSWVVMSQQALKVNRLFHMNCTIRRSHTL